MTIPYGRQLVDQDDIDAVTAVLRGDWLTTGPAVDAFEQAIADYVEAEFAVAYSNGTAALHGAAAAAGLGPGDLLVTSPLTFMASANAGRFVGADVGLVDIEASTFNIDLSRVPSTADAVVAVHYAGLPVDLRAMTNRPRIVIEDAAHALGSTTPDGPVGNCAHSDMTCFSFHPVKPVTTAEGGVVTTNDPELAQRLRLFRTHNIEPDPSRGGWFYEISELGFNYRLTDVQAALGVSQMGKLDAFIDRRNDIAARYRAELADSPILLPPAASEGWRHGYHLFAVRVPDRDRVFAELRGRGVGVQVHYVPIHHHAISEDLVSGRDDLPVCDEVYSGLMSLPMFPGLTDDDQTAVIDTVKDVL